MEYLTVNEVARIIRVSPAVVRTMHKNKILKGVKFPGRKRLLFKKQDVDLFLAQN